MPSDDIPSEDESSGAADVVVPKLQEFVRDYHNAAARYHAYGESTFESLGSTDDVSEIPDKLADGIIDDKVGTDSRDAYFIGIYEILNKYEYSSGKTLAEYIVELGDRDYPDAVSKRAVYPPVAAMTYGQVQLLRLNGIGLMTTFLSNSESLLDNADEYFGKLKNMLSKLKGNGNERISVRDGVDKTVFDSQIAMTSAKLYSQDAGDVSNAQKKPFGVMTFLSKAQEYLKATPHGFADQTVFDCLVPGDFPHISRFNILGRPICSRGSERMT